MSNVPDMPYGLRGCGACCNDQGRRGYRRTDFTRHLNSPLPKTAGPFERPDRTDAFAFAFGSSMNM
jgi:hypothetical protein